MASLSAKLVRQEQEQEQWARDEAARAEELTTQCESLHVGDG